jgi:sugar lactone lactonase YvrE
MSCAKWVSVAALITFGYGCSSDEGDPEPALVCPAGPAAGNVTEFAIGLNGTEGIAFTSDGRLFVGSGGKILELNADGSSREHASVPQTVGMAAWNGALYVASGDDGSHDPGAFCADSRKGAIYKVTMDGQVSLFATGIKQPNFVTVTPWNTLLVADDCASNNNIYEVNAQGQTSVWIDSVPSANGMAFDATNSSLFVATTFVNPPPLYRIGVGANGKPTEKSTAFTYETNSSPDGLVLDADGNVFVALNVLGVIHKFTKAGEDVEFAGGMMTPASLAFGVGAKFDPCSMYVTSLFGSSVYKVRVGTRGLELKR